LQLSIIIPTLNEVRTIEFFLQRLSALRKRGAEVIIVDGGSDEGTLEIARRFSDQTLSSPPGRAVQMNAGAALAKGQILLFLHADSVLPEDTDHLITQALKKTARVWGRFDIRIDSAHPVLRIVAMMINLRTRMTGIATGDQAIFVRSEIFNSIGGYPTIALMEDIALSKLLLAKSKPVSIDARVTTSARRWTKNGIFRTIILMWRLRLCYFFGTDPKRLAHLYEGKQRGA
jgi:rSAM/selenodomain-associated transferase 2